MVATAAATTAVAEKPCCCTSGTSRHVSRPSFGRATASSCTGRGWFSSSRRTRRAATLSSTRRLRWGQGRLLSSNLFRPRCATAYTREDATEFLELIDCPFQVFVWKHVFVCRVCCLFPCASTCSRYPRSGSLFHCSLLGRVCRLVDAHKINSLPIPRLCHAVLHRPHIHTWTR